MSKIFYLMGKSASGKDTIYKEVKERIPELKTIVIYTTRPIREGEREGVEYHFVDEARLQELQEVDKVIELRAYNTVHGVWKYFTVDDGQFDADDNYIAIGTHRCQQKVDSLISSPRAVIFRSAGFGIPMISGASATSLLESLRGEPMRYPSLLRGRSDIPANS